MSTRKRKAWRAASVAKLPPCPRPCTLEYISRLPVVTPDAPMPMPMEQVVLLVPGYDPHRDAGGCVFDAKAARKAVSYFHEICTHDKGPLRGQPLVLQLWQQAIVANLFGWHRKDTGLRRFTDAFVFVPRKNGKTTMAAGLVLYLLFSDGEHGPEVYSAAAEKDQAALVFVQAKGMVEREPMLASRGRVYRALKSIEYEDEGGVYRAISADSETKHGFNTHAYIMDELHAQRNRNLLDALETSTGSREQPVGIVITTADFDGPSICNEKQDYAEAVRDGTILDSTMLPVLYLLAPEAAQSRDFLPYAEATMRLANPNYGISVRAEYLAKKARMAQAAPAFLNTYLRLHLNVRTQAAVAAVLLEDLDACPHVDLDALAGQPCYGGLDLASTQDLTAFALWFPEQASVLVHTWLPRETAIKREEGDKVPYYTWSQDDAQRLSLTPGAVCDYQRMRADIGKLAERYRIQAVAFDRWNSQQIVTDLTDDGLEMVAFGQGFASMSAPTKEWVRLITGHACAHEHVTLLRWCVGNTMLDTDAAANAKPSKKTSKEKIDPVVAWIMALGMAALQPQSVSLDDVYAPSDDDEDEGGLYA